MFTCPQCGFTYGELPRSQLPDRMAAYGPLYANRLTSASAALRRRPSPEQWSPLEYSCHVRDVALMQRDRLYVALVEEEPSFKPMYREERVAFDRYEIQDPAGVADQLTMAVTMLANAFAGLHDEQWDRPLLYGSPKSSRQDVEWVAHHTLHEMAHHLWDVDGILAAP